MTTIINCLSSEEITKLESSTTAMLTGLLEKQVEDLTLRELRFIAATLNSTKFSYPSDVLKLVKSILA